MKHLIDLIDNTKTDKNTTHSYLSVYESLFNKRRMIVTDVMEIGIHEGGSIQLWSDYFINATIYGVDTNNSLIKGGRIKTLNADAYTEKFIKTLPEMDIIIDDGPHTLKSQQFFAYHYSKLLKKNGILVIEDIANIKNVDSIINKFPDRDKGRCIDLRKEKGRFDDILIIYEN